MKMNKCRFRGGGCDVRNLSYLVCWCRGAFGVRGNQTWSVSVTRVCVSSRAPADRSNTRSRRRERRRSTRRRVARPLLKGALWQSIIFRRKRTSASCIFIRMHFRCVSAAKRSSKRSWFPAFRTPRLVTPSHAIRPRLVPHATFLR